MLFEPAILSVLQFHDVMFTVFQNGLLYALSRRVYLLLMEVFEKIDYPRLSI